MKGVVGFKEYRVLDLKLSGRRCQLDSKSVKECANEAYSLYVSENPQMQSKKTATDSTLCYSKGRCLSFVVPNSLSSFEIDMMAVGFKMI